MITTTAEKAGKMSKDKDRKEDEGRLITYVSAEVQHAFQTKAKDPKFGNSTGAAVLRDFVHEYIKSEKPERVIPQDVQEILPAFIDFMSTPPKEKHLRSLWDALWIILKNRAEKRK